MILIDFLRIKLVDAYWWFFGESKDAQIYSDAIKSPNNCKTIFFFFLDRTLIIKKILIVWCRWFRVCSMLSNDESKNDKIIKWIGFRIIIIKKNPNHQSAWLSHY